MIARLRERRGGARAGVGSVAKWRYAARNVAYVMAPAAEREAEVAWRNARRAN